ncbi:anaerobic sulfatase maturase [Natronospora cellulosivora (SeqCode)]
MTEINFDDKDKSFKLKKRFFNVMVFPSGPACNLNCDYCYYLDKIDSYSSDTSFKMDYNLIENFTKQYIEAQPGPFVNFGWQGGEPTLRGLEFFKKAVELQEKYLPEGWKCQNSFQTNALLIDEKWCQFFSDNNFLLGVSIDGPDWIHDHYRKDKKGVSTHQKVVESIKLLQKYKVDFNILCVVNDLNAKYPLEIYNFFKDLAIDFIQFIPIVENDSNGNLNHSVKPEDYAYFLISIFDQWLKNDYGQINIQIFEEAVRVWAGYKAGLCVFSKTCGNAEVMEHNGDLYSCDHFVFDDYKLGNIKETPLLELVNSNQQKDFGNDKYDSLPEKCLNCEVNFICQGGCPKNRIISTEDGEKGLNYLCFAYQRFFKYIDPYMKEIAWRLQKRQTPTVIQKELVKIQDELWDIGRNDICVCGSGKKYKKCCIGRI